MVSQKWQHNVYTGVDGDDWYDFVGIDSSMLFETDALDFFSTEDIGVVISF